MYVRLVVLNMDECCSFRSAEPHNYGLTKAGVMINYNIPILLGALFLSTASIVLILHNASEEPFYSVASIYEPIIHVGMAMLLITAWVQFDIYVLVLIYKKSILCIHIISVIVSVAMIIVLGFCVLGYANDLYIGTNGMIPV